MNEDDKEDLIVEYLARMCAIIIFGLIVAFVITMCSCTRTVYIPQTTVQHDSIFLHTHSRDSIIIKDSVTIREKGDTVWLTRWRTEYRDRLLVDTAYIEHRDTIRVPYPVERKLTKWESFKIGLRYMPMMFVTSLAVVIPVFMWLKRRGKP